MSGHAEPSFVDPGLAEVLRGGTGDDEIALAVRLNDDALLPHFVRQVSRMGPIATLRVRRDRLGDLATCGAIDTAEPARAVRETETVAHTGDLRALMPGPETRRPAGVSGFGEGVVIACLDTGLDFALPDFRHPGPDGPGTGGTRLLGLWDQRGQSDGNHFGYGKIYTAAAIDAALATNDPYAALGYHPGKSDRRARQRGHGGWVGTHGTHVLSIAAGNGEGGSPMGVAPRADLIFASIASTTPILFGGVLGDSIAICESLAWVFDLAGDRPCVVNISMGAQGSGHDGSSAVEQFIDAAVTAKPGRAVVNSAGNYRHKRIAAQGRVARGTTLPLRFSVPPSDPTRSEIELFYSVADQLTVSVTAPDGSETPPVGLDEDAPIFAEGRSVGHIYHHRRKPLGGNGDRHVDLFLWRDAPEGDWRMTLHGKNVRDGRFHAWIERDSGRSPAFTGPEMTERSTTGSLANGMHSITVGATNPRAPGLQFGQFSSSGPTRDGRTKPEIAAPGVAIVAAKSTPPDGSRGPRSVAKSGTSMAAPHVVGATALIFQASARPLEISDTRAILFGSARRPEPVTPETAHLMGYGILDIVAAETAARRFGDDRAADLAVPAITATTTQHLAETAAEDAMPTDYLYADAIQGSTAAPAVQWAPPVTEAQPRYTVPSRVADWEDLIRFRPSSAVLKQIASGKLIKYRLQTIPGAKSDNINLDYYPVYVSRMPTYQGRQMTGASLFRRFRLKINDYLDIGLSEFTPVSVRDAIRWVSPNPVGTVIFIDIEGPDNAYVVCSDATPTRWRFSTLTREIPLDSDEHPVSGTREFGYHGSQQRAVFYTRGADRATYRLEFLNRKVFEGGHNLWRSFQREFVNWVNRHGGRAERFAFGSPRPDTFISRRVSWSKVRRELEL